MHRIRKKTARWVVFAAVGNEHSEAIGATAAEKSLPAHQKKHMYLKTVHVLFSI